MDKTPWLDIHKMSQHEFDTFLFDMPMWAKSLWKLVLKHGDMCDAIDARAFFTAMHRFTGINDYLFWESEEQEAEGDQ